MADAETAVECSPQDGPILVYDGNCGLCQRSVVFILAHEEAPVLRFAAQSSEVGRNLISRAALPKKAGESVILFEEGKTYFLSDAALRCCRYLKAPWRFFRVLMVVPRPLRDWAYRIVAKYRHRWFSSRNACVLPGAVDAARFLDGLPAAESVSLGNQR